VLYAPWLYFPCDSLNTTLTVTYVIGLLLCYTVLGIGYIICACVLPLSTNFYNIFNMTTWHERLNKIDKGWKDNPIPKVKGAELYDSVKNDKYNNGLKMQDNENDWPRRLQTTSRFKEYVGLVSVLVNEKSNNICRTVRQRMYSELQFFKPLATVWACTQTEAFEFGSTSCSLWTFLFPLQLCGSYRGHAKWLPDLQNTDRAPSMCICVDETLKRELRTLHMTSQAQQSNAFIH